jgi:hypothetical protein
VDFVPILVLAALVKKLVDFVRAAKAGDHNGIVTQLVAWVGGILVVMLAAHTAWADGIDFGDTTLGDMNLASQILAGLALASSASLAADFTPKNVSPPVTR